MNWDCNDQLYNADESGLFWKLLPGKTYVSALEKTPPGVKIEKQRVTFLCCANETGSHRLKLLVIGKAKNPRCFKNFNCPTDYKSSKSSWMTISIVQDWFHQSFVPQVKAFLRSKDLPMKALLLIEYSISMQHPISMGNLRRSEYLNLSCYTWIGKNQQTYLQYQDIQRMNYHCKTL